MRFALLTASALAAATVLAAPAMAQDNGPDAEFTGPRAEVIAGWDRVGGNDGVEAKDGIAFGGAVGYDFQAGGAVFGIEGEVTGATTKASDTDVFAAGDRLTVKAGRDLYVGGRVGFLAGPRTLIYAKGGYTNAGFETRYRLGNAYAEDHDTVDGWRLGAGAEFKLNDKMYVKGEYRYSNYGHLNGQGDIDLDRHQVVAGVGVRF
jgi:outer membrane immunogenic protein